MKFDEPLQTPVPVTLVVVENGGRPSEPYLGRPPEDDECFVFGQHPLETPFVLDLRLRERMGALVDRGHCIREAVLVWDRLEPTREIVRRARLVANRISVGGTLILACKQPMQRLVAQDAAFHEFTQDLANQLSPLGVELLVYAEGQKLAPAALSGSWHRVQHFDATAALFAEAASDRGPELEQGEAFELSAEFESGGFELSAEFESAEFESAEFELSAELELTAEFELSAEFEGDAQVSEPMSGRENRRENLTRSALLPRSLSESGNAPVIPLRRSAG